MNKDVRQVAEFMASMNQPVQQYPAFPTRQQHDMRVAFLREEIKELEDAYQNGSLAEYADAIIDTQYVLNGLKLETGIQYVEEPMFDEVHRANMTKTTYSRSDVEASVNRLAVSQPGETFKTEIGVSGRWLIKRVSDGKVMKPYTFTPPDLSKFIAPQFKSE